MSRGFPARRRADQFAEIVDGARAGDAARDAELLELVGALRSVPRPTARPEFVADLRERLLAEAVTALVPADTTRLRLPERHPVRERRIAAIVGGIAVVGATTSVAMAAQSALPGDSLYPVKRAIESVQTGLAVGEGSKGSTMLANASDRLDEVTSLTEQDDFGDDVRVADTLNTFTDQATQASDLLLDDYAHTGHASSIVELRTFAATSLTRLEQLEPTIPADARDELIRAAGVIGTIDSEAARRCPDCGGVPVVSIPPTLTSAEQVLLPRPPAVQPAAAAPAPRSNGHRRHPGGGRSGSNGAPLPAVGSDLPPGSVSEPGSSPLPGARLPASTQTGGSNPLQDLANGLVGGGTKPSGSPSTPSVGGLVDDVGQLLQGVIDPSSGSSLLP